MTLMTLIFALVSDDAGQDLLEYGLLAGLIAVVAIVAVTATGGSIAEAFGRIPEDLREAGLAAPAP